MLYILNKDIRPLLVFFLTLFIFAVEKIPIITLVHFPIRMTFWWIIYTLAFSEVCILILDRVVLVHPTARKMSSAPHPSETKNVSKNIRTRSTNEAPVLQLIKILKS